VIPIDEINIGIARRSKQHSITGCASGKRMSRRVVFPQVGFDFYNPRREKMPGSASY